jgi:CheY-like chemotaxis protein
VGDVGIGMTEETRRRVFEPFYTTKEVGKGTGLGLSTVFAVVRRMGGTISISTALGKGTTFTLNLPVVIAEPALARDDSDDAAPGEGETVLIVDDDALIRMTVETYVESLGYRALTAANVPDALKIYMESTRPIDAVLTDIMMPGLLGSELGRILHTNAPEIAVIFMSAHPHRELVRKGHVHEDAHWLSKPFDAHELGVTLRHALKDRARSEPPQRLRIFAIDDDADVLEALRDLLELDGHSVGVATTTHDALRDVPRFVPDVVLCDVNLEEPSSGIDLVARLRRDEQLQKTSFLAVTGMAPNPIRPTAMAAGFEDVLTKPLDFQKLSRDLVSRVRR